MRLKYRVRMAMLTVILSAGTVACVTHPPSESMRPCFETILRLERVPQLGERLSHLEPSCTRTMAASAQMWPSYEAIVTGIKFTVGTDADAHVRFLATTDPSFATPEGLHVGDAVAAAVRAAPTQSIVREPGWGHYIALPSGWYAFIDDSQSDPSGRVDLNLGTRELASNARVTMFFMRE